MTMTSPISLRIFLLHARTHLEASLRQKQPIHLVIGNESADLDSIASTLLYAYFRSYSHNSSSPSSQTSPSRPNASPSTTRPTLAFSKYYIPVLNIPSSDISIRPELLALLPHVGLEQSQLITLSDLPSPPYTKDLPAENTEWTLVDHNALQGTLGEAYRSRVLGCIDHHDDEGRVPSSEDERHGEPRIIEVAGSCTSLVINHFSPAWDGVLESSKPTQTSSSSSSNDVQSQARDSGAAQSRQEATTQLAKLALASILIDTSNLQITVKTTEHDRRAVAFLEMNIAEQDFDRKAYFKMLQTAKKDLDGLKMCDVLRKDYKEWNEGGRKLGVSSVVKPLEWLSDKAGTEDGADEEGGKGTFKKALQDFAIARDLAVYAIMTTSTSAKTGEFTRELLLYIRDPSADGMVQNFMEKAGEKLGLQKWQEDDKLISPSSREDDHFQIWHQRKVENSRKQVAPLLRAAMASL